MDIIVSQKHLANALANASRIATTKNDLPALASVLLRTEGKNLVISSTNLELATTQKISAKINHPGETTLPAKLVYEYVQNLSDDTIAIKEVGSQIKVSSGASVSKFNTIPVSEFPELPALLVSRDITEISADTLKDAIAQVVIAVSSDTTRPALTGVYWQSIDGVLYFAATDGYRLAERKVVEVSSEMSLIVPAATIHEITRLITDNVDTIQFVHDDSQIIFTINDITLISRLIEGNFPDYRQLIPKDNSTSATVKKDELSRIVKIANIFARETGNGITLAIEDGNLDVKSIASEKGENISSISVKSKGDSGSVSLNARYLIDVLQVINPGDIEIGYSGKLAPIVMRDSSSSDYTYIIMPLKS